jgi:hypothetical protein
MNRAYSEKAPKIIAPYRQTFFNFLFSFQRRYYIKHIQFGLRPLTFKNFTVSFNGKSFKGFLKNELKTGIGLFSN